MEVDAMILDFCMLSFKPAFSLFFPLKRLFSSALLSAIGGIICISQVVDISPGNPDSRLYLIQPGWMMYSACQIISRVTIYTLDILLSQFWTSPLFISGSNCCFLSCIQDSQETGKVVWYSHLLKSFPVCCDPHSQRLEHSQSSRCFSGIL